MRESHTGLSYRQFFLAALVVLSACAEKEPQSSVASNGLAYTSVSSGGASTTVGEVRDNYLYGDLTATGCTADEAEVVKSGHEAGKLIARTPFFGSCVVHRMAANYEPCRPPGKNDPYSGAPQLVRITKSLEAMRRGNTAAVSVQCEDLPHDVHGRAYIGSYGNQREEVLVDTDFIALKSQDSGSHAMKADVARVIWHEAMHQQGYSHDNCGYPAEQYSILGSVPYVSGDCTLDAGVSSRVTLLPESGGSVVLGTGRHLSSRGDLAALNSRTVLKLIQAPYTDIRLCSSETPSEPDSSCVFKAQNPSFQAKYHTLVVPARGFARVDVEPMVNIYSQPQYAGRRSFLPRGVYRGSMAQLGEVGDNETRSMMIPPGARVLACSDEGAQGEGGGVCRSYDQPLDEGSLADGVSYANVQPAVSVFTARNLYAEQRTFGPGRYHGIGLRGDNNIESLVVPAGMAARVCSDVGVNQRGAGACATFFRSTMELDVGLAGSVSYLEITGPEQRTGLLRVVANGINDAANIFSVPAGIQCPGNCEARFSLNSEVRLYGTRDLTIRWAGCSTDSSARVCRLDMNTDKTVRAVAAPVDCIDSCRDACIDEGRLTPGQCVQRCANRCSQ